MNFLPGCSARYQLWEMQTCSSSVDTCACVQDFPGAACFKNRGKCAALTVRKQKLLSLSPSCPSPGTLHFYCKCGRIKIEHILMLLIEIPSVALNGHCPVSSTLEENSYDPFLSCG